MTEIRHTRPPNFSMLAEYFPGAHGRGVVFAYAPFIYAPFVTVIRPEIMAHEEAHIERQLEIGVDVWWRRYIDNDEFRYNEELIGHRAEYRKLCELCPTRQVRRSALKEIARKLASPLYGGMVSVNKAMEDIAA